MCYGGSWYNRLFKHCDWGDDFEQQIEEHKGMHGKKCDFVLCEYEHPDFRALSEEQLEYYLYFRDRFFGDDMCRADVGYVWLLMIELINTGDDPKKVMEDLLSLDFTCRFDKELTRLAYECRDATFSYALANGLDVPRTRPNSNVLKDIMISELLLPMPEDIPTELMDMLTDGQYLRYSNPDPENICTDILFNAALPAVDAKMRELTGKGILETYGEEKTSAVSLFVRWNGRCLPYFRERECTVTYTKANDGLKSFLGGMMRYCQQVMERKACKTKGPSVPSIFGKEYRKAVDEVFNNGKIIEPERPPKTVRGSVRSFAIGEMDRPIVLGSTGFSDEDPPSSFLQAMIKYSKKEAPGERKYIPSGFKRPSYSRLSAKAREYYLWWRQCAREGKYGATDEGYLWLYKCELINAYDDMRYVLDQLAGLARAYDKYIPDEWFGETKKPGRAYLDYAFINGLQIPDPTVFPCILSASDMVEMLLDGEEDTPVSANTMLVAAQFVGDKKSDAPVRAAFDDDCAHIAARTLMRINDSHSGDVVRKYCRLRTKKIKMNVFVHEKYYKWPTGRQKAQEREMLNIVENDTFLPEMKTLVKAVIAAVRDRDKPRKGKGTYAFGVPLDDMLQNEVKKWFCEKNARAAEKRLLSFSIDQSEVDRAQADLDHVTSIMSTEEQAVEDAPETEKEAPKADPEDPWQAFADRLNKGQKDYLRKALAGTLRSAKPMIEDAINAVAMDTVKDTVLENGEVFDEYADDIRKGLVFDDDRVP